jgi:hypothetical protein
MSQIYGDDEKLRFLVGLIFPTSGLLIATLECPVRSSSQSNKLPVILSATTQRRTSQCRNQSILFVFCVSDGKMPLGLLILRVFA